MTRDEQPLPTTLHVPVNQWLATSSMGVAVDWRVARDAYHANPNVHTEANLYAARQRAISCLQKP